MDIKGKTTRSRSGISWKLPQLHRTLNSITEAALDYLSLVNRNKKLFSRDILLNEEKLAEIVKGNSFLVIGGAGTIGQSVVKQIFKRNPRILHVVDISENNLVELVRDIRSSLGYIAGDFKTFALDVGSEIFEAFWKSSAEYDYVLNLSALKHVRSEKDIFSIMRMIDVNILNSMKLAQRIQEQGKGNYFCVSTDKAANPANVMGASKRLMEKFILGGNFNFNFTMARFANVAFSDGSLPFGFVQRIMKNQPISAPKDIKRYFVTPEESGELCLCSALLGENAEIFFPKSETEMELTTFSDVAINFLKQQSLKPIICDSEEEARFLCNKLDLSKEYPCYFFNSDTTGEKPFEEFYTATDNVNLDSFVDIGVIKTETHGLSDEEFNAFQSMYQMLLSGSGSKTSIVEQFQILIPEFDHLELGKYLDERM